MSETDETVVNAEHPLRSRIADLAAEIERLRKQCVFLRDRSAEGQQLLHRALAHIDTTQSLYKEVHGHLYPQDQEEHR